MMNSHLKFFLFLKISLICITVGTGHVHAASPSSVTDLQCEYLVNPIGVDVRNPRLSWKVKDARAGARQTFYSLIVGTDSASLGHSKTDQAWSTGKVRSASQLVTYQGEKLRPFTRYFWAVKVWDQERRSTSLSPVSRFETGMMDQNNWKGAWISDSEDIRLKPAPYFRKSFQASRKIVSARAYIAVAGLYELYINGRKAGNHRLDPVYTRFDRRTIYLAHDITALLKPGTTPLVYCLAMDGTIISPPLYGIFIRLPGETARLSVWIFASPTTTALSKRSVPAKTGKHHLAR